VTLKNGEMFDFRFECPDILLVTANAGTNKKGALIMGRGAALQAKSIFPGIDLTFGRLVSYHLLLEGPKPKPYGVIVAPTQTKPGIIGIFQVKWRFNTPASLELIRFSCETLRRKATGIWKGKTIWLNFPGIGNGQLLKDQVWPLISGLPDNVTIWEGTSDS